MTNDIYKKMTVVTMPIGAIFLAISFLMISPVAAAENVSSTQPVTPLTAKDCKLQDSLDALLKIKDSDISSEERNRAELGAREDVISQIVVCSSVELDAFKKRLTDLDLKDSDEKDRLLRDKFLGDIDAGKFYFSKTNDKLASDLELQDIKELARNIALWRESFYVPALSNINDFILVIEDAQAIKTARARFDKISFSLSAVKLNEVIEIKDLLGQASQHIQKGAELSKQAHDLIWDIDLIFNSASSSPTSTPATTTDSDTFTLNDATSTMVETASSTDTSPRVLPLVKDSLIELRKAYVAYLSISGIVKKYLGL